MSANSLHQKVRTILLTVWDPIGVRDVPQAHDEYDAHVAPIVKLVTAGASAPQLEQHLLGIEIDAMGLSGDRGRARAAAAQLVK